MRNRWIGFVAVVIVTACVDSTKTGGSGGSSTLHCAYSSQGACITLTAPAISAAQQTALQNECTADGGSYGTGGCSTANAVPGTCTVTDPQSLPTTHVAGMTATATFYSPTFNATSAAAQCGSMGTWSAGGGGGGGGGDITSAHCTTSTTCTTYAAPAIGSAQQTSLQTYCAGTGGTYATGACAVSAVVPGTCSVTNASARPTTAITGLVVNRVYLSSSYDASTAAAACGSIGTWVTSGGVGGGGTNITAARCDFPTDGGCFSYSAPAITPTQQAALQGECAAGGGTYGAAACSSTSAVPGTCAVSDPATVTSAAISGLAVTATFYSSMFDATTAASTCGSIGTWSGGGGGGGGGGSNISTASCLFTSDAGCLTFSAPSITPAQQTSLQTQCTGGGGTYAASACSAANALPQTCTMTNGGGWTALGISGLTVVATFYTPTWDATSATSWCSTTNGGGGGGGGGGTSITSASCAYASAGACLTFAAPTITPTQQTSLQGECATGGGTYFAGACSSAGAVPGACTLTNSSSVTATSIAGLTVTTTLYSSAFDSTSAASYCSGIGTWSGGGGGGGGTNITSATCTYSGYCATFTAPAITPAQQTALQSDCAYYAGTYGGTTPCPTTNAIPGTCALTDPATATSAVVSGLAVDVTFYSPTFDATSAANVCGTAGTWSGGGGGGGTVASGDLFCNYTGNSVCFTVNAPAYTSAELTSLQSECSGGGGTSGTGACPTTNAVAGTCTVTNASYLPTTPVAGLTETATFYGPAFTAVTAPASCATFGTWTGSGGGGGGTSTIVSCAIPGYYYCIEYRATSISSTFTAPFESMCTSNAGTYAAAACPTANVVTGYCQYDASGDLGPGGTERDYLYGPTYSVADAQAMCTTPGTWVP